MSAAMGNLSQLAIGTADPPDKRLDFQNSTLGITQEMIDFSGMRGTRSRGVERVRESVKQLTGSLTLYPTAVELASILQWIFWGTPSGVGTVTYPLGDTPQSRYVCLDRVIKVYTSHGVGVSKARFESGPRKCLAVTLDLVGLIDAETAAGTFPAGLTLDSTTKPFMFHDSTIQIAGNTYQSDSFVLEIDNKLNLDRFLNSLTLTEITSTDRLITYSFSLPFGDAYAAYNTGPAGVAVTTTFTYGSQVLTLTSPKVVFKREDPPITGRNDEIMLPLNGEAKKDGATLELSTTLAT